MTPLKKTSHAHYLKPANTIISGLLLSAFMCSPASAHLMVAQHGTVNIVGTGAFLVISLPISAFPGVDDDGDKKLSRGEFTKHRPALVAAVNKKIKLLEKNSPRPLEGMMLSPASPHKNPMAPADQLVIMGRFSLTDTTTRDLTFQFEMFGTEPAAKQQTVSFSNKAQSLKHKVVLTPKHTTTDLFPNNLDTTKTKTLPHTTSWKSCLPTDTPFTITSSVCSPA